MEKTMLYTTIPDFDDALAQVKEQMHYPSGAKLIEVRYGAHNEEGDPAAPLSEEDGHGLWTAIETEGGYEMLSWQHPKAEGGALEFGTEAADHAIQDLEAAIQEKKKLLYDVRTLMSEKRYDTEAADAMLSNYSAIFTLNTPKEKELSQQYEALVERNAANKKRFAEQAASREKKEALIEEAKTLIESTDWKATSQRLHAMMDEYKQAGYAGEESDSLWEAFRAAQKAFFERQEKHFAELDEMHAQSRAAKEELIEQAKGAAESTDWKNTNQFMDDLMAKWKQIGSAGRSDDQKLWEAFHAARDIYYTNRNKARAEQESEFENRRNQKTKLIEEAEFLKGDFSPEASDRMKALSTEWKGIGFCGREYNDALWEQFHAIQDEYWSTKRQESRENLTAAIERRRTRIRNKLNNIQNLKDRIEITRNEDKLNDINRWIEEDEADVRMLEEEIARMERELN